MVALLRTSSAAGKRPLMDTDCTMPTARFRCRAFNSSGVYAGVRAYADIELGNGTVTVVCRMAGTCQIETYFGNFADGLGIASVLQDVASTVSGDVQTVTKVCLAMASGQDREAEIAVYANWICDAYHGPVSGEPAKVQAYADDLTLYRRSRLRYGKTYLATIQNVFGSTNVLVNADEWPGGELFVLDVGTNIETGNNYKETEYVESRVLMIVHLPAGLDLARDTLHKVGTTSTVFTPAFEQATRAKCFNGIVLEDKFERYRIGGDSCPYCHDDVEIGICETPGGSLPPRRMTA